MTRDQKKVLLVLAAAQFCHIMDFMIMMPMGDLLMKLFQISPRQFSLLVSAYTFSAGLSGFAIAFVADRFDRRKLLFWMFAGFILGTLACALAGSYYLLLTARFITGFFGGVIGSIVLAIASDLVPMRQRGEAMGIVNVAFAVASIFGVPFGLLLAAKISWHAPFLFLVVLGVPVFIAIHQWVPKMDTHILSVSTRPWQLLKDVIQNANQRWALLLVCLIMFVQFSLIPFLSPSMVANVGFSQEQLTWIYFLGGGISILTGPFIGRLSDLIGKTTVFTVASLCAIVPFLWITHMGPTPIFLALVVTSSFFVVSGGRMIPAFAITSGTAAPSSRGSFMSFQASMQSLSGAIASFVSGLVVSKDPSSGQLLHYDLVGYVAVFFTLLSLVVVRFIVPIEQDSIH